MSPRESETAYMMDAKSEALVKSVNDLLVEKQGIMKKEREFIQSLNSVLRKVGYEVVPIAAGKPGPRESGRRPGRPRKRRGPGRPRKVGRPRWR
jgi:hypothetical protein